MQNFNVPAFKFGQSGDRYVTVRRNSMHIYGLSSCDHHKLHSGKSVES